MKRLCLLLAFVCLAVTAQAQSSLATLANSMQPGTWAPLTTIGMNATLNSVGSSGSKLSYEDALVYEPTSRRFFFMGSDHNDPQTFLQFDVASNTWSRLPRASFMTTTSEYLMGTQHGYDHGATRPGFYFKRQNGDDELHRYNVATQQWDNPPLPPNPFQAQFGDYHNGYDAMEYFPEMGGMVWVSGNGIVYFFSDATQQWTRIATGLANGGTWTQSAYNPVHKVLIFDHSGGFFKLSATGQVTRLSAPPVSFYDGSGWASTMTADPVSGKYLVLTASSRNFWEYDVTNDTWRQLTATNKPAMNLAGVGGAPVAEYGVILYAVCQSTNCQTWLYKHASGGTPPPPPPPPPGDATPPTVTMTAPTTGATVSGATVNVSATATDNVGVVGVQFKVDGVNLGTEDLGPNYSKVWDTTGFSNASHTILALARDAAGNSTTATVTVTVNNGGVPPPPPPPSDFTTRCSAAGVVKCVGFDQAADIAGGYGANSGIFSGVTTPQLDTAVAASGASSLKMTIPSNSGADTSGSYFTNFSSDLSVQFGENAEFYIQWRQRFSPEFLNTLFVNGGGWKQSIIGTGDQPGKLYFSCTALHVVTQNTYQRGFAQMYNSCTGSASHGAYDPFEESFNGTYKLQNARPSPYCLYSQSSTGFFPPNGNCFGYFPNEWMTFQVGIKTGPRVGDEFTNSFVQMWIARQGQPSELVMNWGPYKLSAGSLTENQKYGKVWLLPYNTGKDAAQTHPVGYIWYDELIISRTRIADPGGVTPPPPPVNTAPITSAGPDKTITLPAAASLTGTVTDDGLPNGALTYQWSGAGATFSTPNAIATQASFATAGTYTVTLTASDGVLSRSDSTVITVLPAVPPPPTGDTVAPVVTITNRTNGSTFTGNIPSFTIKATDNIAVVRIELWVDGYPRAVATHDPQLTALPDINGLSWRTRNIPTGSVHTVTAKAYDAAGNVGTTTITVTKQ